jgi:hypothetical protein
MFWPMLSNKTLAHYIITEREHAENAEQALGAKLDAANGKRAQEL